MALMTASALRDAIPELTGTAEDTRLETLIARIDATFATYCGYPAASATASPTLESASYTLYLTGNGGRELRLPIRPVTAITSIEEDEDLTFDGSSYLVASSDYTLVYDPARGQFVRLKYTATHSAWGTTPLAIKAVVTAGYSTVPGNILEAARMAARDWWQRRSRSGLTSRSGGQGGSQSFRDEIIFTPEIEIMLAQFCLPQTVLGGGLG